MWVFKSTYTYYIQEIKVCIDVCVLYNVILIVGWMSVFVILSTNAGIQTDHTNA